QRAKVFGSPSFATALTSTCHSSVRRPSTKVIGSVLHGSLANSPAGMGPIYPLNEPPKKVAPPVSATAVGAASNTTAPANTVFIVSFFLVLTLYLLPLL